MHADDEPHSWDREAAEAPTPGAGLAKRAGRLTLGLARVAGAAALDLVVPPVCVACERRIASRDALCAGCWRAIRFIRAPLCDRLGIPLPYATGGRQISAAAAQHPPPYDRARAVGEFDGVMRDLVHRLKYGDRQHARSLFGRWLVLAADGLLEGADLIVPVPMHWRRLLARRFNQAALLAGEVAARTAIAFEPRLIERIKPTRSQTELSAAERERNLAGAIRVRPGASGRLEGRNVILVDDVITTGTTVGVCARVLKRAGARRVEVLALALVPPR